ncbi:MAG: type II secretion system protein [Pseudomonadota bacterium]
MKTVNMKIEQNKVANKQLGFSLIELVIVIVVLGLLAATAIPRFIDVTKDAEDAATAAVAGSFATGVSLVRSQWEVDGRPSGNSSSDEVAILIGGLEVGIDRDTGYPTGHVVNDDSTEDTEIVDEDCQSIFSLLLQSPPSITADWDTSTASDFNYFTNASQNTGIQNNDTCTFYLMRTVKNLNSEPLSTLVGNGFTYDPRIGQVSFFSNN